MKGLCWRYHARSSGRCHHAREEHRGSCPPRESPPTPPTGEVLCNGPAPPRPVGPGLAARLAGATAARPLRRGPTVGGGVHGLATAYYLAVNHGITDVAVLDKGYIGGGGSGRSTAILRSNYLTPEGVRFFHDRSMQLYRTLAADLDYNVMFPGVGI